ncbi:helix-turn-helix domain-containing protein [Jatrophihabitans sp.]|uniref:TetR/AcrR family transcriptional regulator n=1 Tax=Jatrophihabitans sp. TaxID=1932789 RepID=UPI0030C702EA|nr:TetR-family transcriptional regulator [Jatrophihabitans sp.]
MSQQRNSDRLADEGILDAAYDLLLAIGMRRLTMADIARHAGVSRATMYRRWPNVTAVVGALVTREFGRLATSLAAVPEHDARPALVAGVVQVVGAIRTHPLLRKIIEVDPELLLPYLVERRGQTTDVQLALLEAYLAAGIADGSVRPGEAALLARAVLLTAWSFVLTGPLLVSDRDCTALDAELAELLERYLRP